MHRTQMTTITFSDPDQERAWEDAQDLVERDVDRGEIEADVNDVGPRAGEIPYGEVLRVIAEAYTGGLE